MFRIWYEDHFVDGEGIEDWQSLPSEGVLAIYQTHEIIDGIRFGNICSGSDWYWMTDQGLIEQNGESLDEPGTWVDISLPSNYVAKKGIWTSNERIEEVNQALIEMAEN